MNNNQIPKIRQDILNFYQMPNIQNEHFQLGFTQNNLSMPLPINQNFLIYPNYQSPQQHLLFPDQFLYPNQSYFLQKIFLLSQLNQINPMDHLILCQNLLNENKVFNYNKRNEQIIEAIITLI